MPTNINEPPDFENEKGLVVVNKVTVNALNLLGANHNTPKKASEIYNKVKEIYPKFESYMSIKVFRVYLSALSTDGRSAITKPEGKHGYFINVSIDNDENIESDEIESDHPTSARTNRERLLYPFLRDWLMSQGYRAKDTSLIKGNSRWGNPDITGLKIIDNVLSTEIEIATIEAKASLRNWKIDFFEAVAHRRFSNRAYFAFPIGDNKPREVLRELRYYSELYEVGVLLISMPEAALKEYESTGILPLENIEDYIDIIEFYTAKFNNLPIMYQKDFYKSLGIKERKDLYEFGEGIDIDQSNIPPKPTTLDNN